MRVPVDLRGEALQFVSDVLKADKRVVVTALMHTGMALRHAAQELRENPEIVMAAVHQCGESLQFASEQLQSDEDIVLTAVLHGAAALPFAAETLRGDWKIVYTAVQQDGMLLRTASNDMKADIDVAVAAVTQNGMALALTASEIRANRAVVHPAVRQCGLALQYASDELRADSEITADAIAENPDASAFVLKSEAATGDTSDPGISPSDDVQKMPVVDEVPLQEDEQDGLETDLVEETYERCLDGEAIVGVEGVISDESQLDESYHESILEESWSPSHCDLQDVPDEVCEQEPEKVIPTIAEEPVVQTKDRSAVDRRWLINNC